MNIRRYALVFIGTSLGLWALTMLALLVFEFDISNGGMVILPPLVAAMIEGHRFARSNGRLPEKLEMWKFARLAALVVMAVTMVFTVIMTFFVPELRELMAQRMGAGVLLALVVLQALIAFLVTRFFLGFGAKSGLNER